MQILDVLRSLPVKIFEGHGALVSFADIIHACSLLGQNNHELIKHKLIELEDQGILKVIYMEQSGFEDLVVGIRLGL
ncbi:hypothetical protein P4V64_31400 [Bacillus thuringiensis]|nr:hypothetical protein [Bacillus thuringiensis]